MKATASLFCLLALLLSALPLAAQPPQYTITVSASAGAVKYGGGTCTITASLTGTAVNTHHISFAVTDGPVGKNHGSIAPTFVQAQGNTFEASAQATYTSGPDGGVMTITATDNDQGGANA